MWKIHFRLISFNGSEFLDLHLDLLNAVLVELLPVPEEEEDLQDDEEGRRDEGLVPGVQQRGGPTLEHAVPDKLNIKHDILKMKCFNVSPEQST